MIPWLQAWQEALYGPDGFYRRPEGPAGHFTTSTHAPLGAVFARAVGALADRFGVCRVVDFAAGRGELLTELHRLRPDLELVGVEVVSRPPSLAADVGWLCSPGGATVPAELADLEDTLVFAHEWLDVVPCAIAEVDDDGIARTVLVDPATGNESLGEPLSAAEADWAQRWWPAREPGARIEIGSTRDAAWDDLCSRVRSGAVVAVDYGHTSGDRPRDGSLIGFAQGVPTHPVPDGRCDLTAHVAMDALSGAQLSPQRDLLHDLGLVPTNPSPELARADPGRYLELLAERSTLAHLRDPAGLGRFLWAIRDV